MQPTGVRAAGYRKHFGVDWVCTFKELEMLGVGLDPEYVARVLRSAEDQITARQRGKAEREESLQSGQRLIDQDENFAYVAGYAPAGFPYGITWEEWEEIDDQEIEQS